MNPAEMIVLVVLIAVLGSILLGRQHYTAEARRRAFDPEAERLRDEVRLLRDRVQVLERVITDQHGSAGLDREIEQLRGQ